MLFVTSSSPPTHLFSFKSVTIWFNTEEDEEPSEGQEMEEDEEIKEIGPEDRLPDAGIDVVAQITLVDKSVTTTVHTCCYNVY